MQIYEYLAKRIQLEHLCERRQNRLQLHLIVKWK